MTARSSTGSIAGRFILVLLVSFAVLVVFAPAEALALHTHLFVETFGSSPQVSFEKAAGLAVEEESGDLIVLDRGAATVSRFKPNGAPDPFSSLGTNVIDGKRGPGGKPCAEEITSCDATPQDGLVFKGFPDEQQIAVDNSGTVTDGDIYVTQGVPSGSAPALVDIFGPDGTYLGQITGTSSTGFATVGFGPCGVAVGTSGNLFIAGFLEPGFESVIYKFSQPAGLHNPLQNSDATAPIAAALPTTCDIAAGQGGTANSLYVAGVDPSTGNGVMEFSEDGGFQGSFGAGKHPLLATESGTGDIYAGRSNAASEIVQIEEYSGDELIGSVPVTTTGFAADSGAERLYVSNYVNGSGNTVSVYGPLVTLPDVVAEKATTEGPETVTLEGTVDPDGEPLDECFFEYGLTSSYGLEAPCEGPSAADVGAGEGPVPVHAKLEGLQREAGYHFRLVADNANAALYPNAPEAISRSRDESFQMPAKPVIESQWATTVGVGEATLGAVIDQNEAATSYRVEWGETAAYGNQTPGAQVATEPDSGDHTVTVGIGPLKPATTYHYRFLATNALGEVKAEDGSFVTYALPVAESCPANEAFREGPSASLPDCRAYEMVSPLDKEGGDTLVLGELLTSLPATLDQSSVNGERLAYGSSRAFAGADSSAFTSQYVAERHAGEGWTTHLISPPRERPIYEPGGQTDTEFRYFSEDLCEGWLQSLATGSWATSVGAPSGYSDLFRRVDDNCGGPIYEPLNVRTPSEVATVDYGAELQGVAGHGDQSISVFAANSRLASGATQGPVQLYVSQARGVKFACVLPGGADLKGSCTAGWASEARGHYRSANVSNALSADGSKLYWTASVGGEAPIYLRENALGSGSECTTASSPCTLAVSTTAEAETGASGSHFEAAAADGSRAIFTTPVVVGGQPSADERLYEWQAATATAHLIAGEVIGVLGAGSDLARIYFASREVLGGTNDEGKAPVAGAANLYLQEGSSVRFIGTLAASDIAGNQDSPVAALPSYHVARVSADGSRAVFQSRAPLTGYDNADASTGEPDAEVYLYDADAEGGEGRLLCPSCNPSGARPHGATVSGRPVASQIPVPENFLYASRVLSNSGDRLFFNSFDSLVPGDSNGRQDVYEWEAPGEGGCRETGATYSAEDGGCVDLISSGDSPLGTEFVDATPSGDDVFFTTLSSLVPQDPGSVDIYDARVGGGLPSPAAAISPCEGEACQPVGPAAPAIQGPGSFRTREGNPARTTPRCPAGRRPKKQGGKSGCVKKASGKHPSHHKRKKSRSAKGKKHRATKSVGRGRRTAR